jgi:predicted SAM-dependent methyltransferase
MTDGDASRRLHIGCGPVLLPGWTNIDLDNAAADMQLDVRDGLPFPDSSVEFIFAEHFIEHLLRAEAVAFLGECHRVLRPGGVVRLSTPNLQVICDAYLARDIRRWEKYWQPATPCQLMNEAFYSWGHRFVYDPDEIRLLLRESAFASFEYAEHSISKYPELSSIETRDHSQEIIVEAVKGL